MIVPGSNLLALALTVIAPQSPMYLRWTGRVLNAKRVQVDTYATAVPVAGSWQPIDVKLAKQYGLDLTKEYATFWATTSFGPVDDDRGADLFVFAGRKWSAQGKVPWDTQDGWNSVLIVDVGPDA